MAFFKEEHELLRKTVRDFTKNEIAPGYKVRSKIDEFNWDINKKMAGLGLLGLKLPQEYGGDPDADYVSIGIVAEELGRGDPSIAFYNGASILYGTILSTLPDNDFKRHALSGMINGDFVCSGGITEPECGSDALAMNTNARREGDSYVINGEKTSISWLRPAEGVLVWAKTDPAKKARGISIIYVPKDTPGVEVGYFEDTGLKSVSRGYISLNDVRVPVANRFGEEGSGFYLIGERFEYLRIIDALAAIGAALASLDETIEYVKTRKAFGQPLSKFQGISFKIAEHATVLEAARLLCYNGLWRLDNHLDYLKESSMCKSWCLRLASEAIYDCLLFHGHYGYAVDLPFEQRLRDVIGLEIADAPPTLHKMVLARSLIGRDFV